MLMSFCIIFIFIKTYWMFVKLLFNVTLCESTFFHKIDVRVLAIDIGDHFMLFATKLKNE